MKRLHFLHVIIFQLVIQLRLKVTNLDPIGSHKHAAVLAMGVKVLFAGHAAVILAYRLVEQHADPGSGGGAAGDFGDRPYECYCSAAGI
jgi:hypothetical protein